MVDAGGRPAGDGWRRMEAAPDGAADVVPLDRYDPARAKIAANLQWICAKAYGRGGPGGAAGAGGGAGAGRLCAVSARGVRAPRSASPLPPGSCGQGARPEGQRPVASRPGADRAPAVRLPGARARFGGLRVTRTLL